FMTGLFFITTDERIASPTYSKMAELMPLSIYGLMMLVSSVLLFCAIFTVNNTRHVFKFLSGMLGAFSIVIYASASTLGGFNIMLPSIYSLISVSCLMFAIAGGCGLWKMSKNTSQE